MAQQDHVPGWVLFGGLSCERDCAIQEHGRSYKYEAVRFDWMLFTLVPARELVAKRGIYIDLHS
jgi:hypothetical protein